MIKRISVPFFLAGIILLLIVLPVLSACSASKAQENQSPPSSAPGTAQASVLQGKITVSGNWALYPMMVKWAEEFQKINPGVKIEVSADGAGKGMADALGGLVDIGMVSRSILPAETERGAVYVASAIDAVVPTANPGNPVKDDLLAKGISRQQFIGIYITGNFTDWKQVFPGTKAFGKTDLHVLTRSDAAGAPETWAAFVGKKQENLIGIGVYGDPGPAETVRRDPLAIGFNNISYAYDAVTKKPVEGLLVIPIDINGNGKIDPEENFYGSLDDLSKAIANKVYPWPPSREENLVVLREFKGVAKEFVKWILTDRQKFAPEAGYVPLSSAKVQEELKKLK